MVKVSQGLFACSAIILVFGACRPPEPETPARPAPARVAVPDEAAQTPLRPGARAPELSEPKELIANGSFEKWQNGAPEAWHAAPADAVQKGNEGQRGVASLELLPAGELYTVVQQALKPDDIVLGGALEVSCLAKTFTPNQFVLKLVYKRGDETVRNAEVHTGRGEWERVHFKVDVPEDADRNSFVLQLLRRSNTEGHVLVDTVSVLAE